MTAADFAQAQIFTAPRGLWWLNLVTAVLTAGLVLLVGGTGIGLIMTAHPVAGLILLLVAAFLVVVLRQVLRNGRGLGGWRMEIDSDTVRLDLPRSRSLAHRLDPVSRTVALSDIAALETRAEAYPTFGMANMNRVYALCLADGSHIILGEDRGLGTDVQVSYVADAAAALTARGIEKRDLGMAEGRGGLLAVAFVQAPEWGAPAIDTARTRAMQLRAGLTGKLALSAGVIVLVLVALQSLL